MSTHTICFYKENQKKKKVDIHFTTSFPSNIEKPKCTVRSVGPIRYHRHLVSNFIFLDPNSYKLSSIPGDKGRSLS